MNGTISSNPGPSKLDNIKRQMAIVSAVIYSVVFVVGTVGNGLVIYVTGFKMKRTVNTVWFLNLSLADFLFTSFLIILIITAAQELHWVFGAHMCKFSNFVTLLSMFASVFFLMAISLDRCLSIWAAVWAHNKRTVCKARVLAVVIWVAAIICSIPFSYFRDVTTDKRSNMTFCTYAKDTPYWSLYIFRFVMGFLVPFLVIFTCNVAIHMRARRLKGKKRRKSQRIIFSIVFAFFVCWLPIHIVYFIELHIPLNKLVLISIVRIAGPLSLCLAFINSCLNPILYVLMCEDFQRKLKQSICFVLESALAEDMISTTTAHSSSTPTSLMSGRSGSLVPPKMDATHENSSESKGVRDKTERMSVV